MSETERFCVGGGYIVGGREWLPEDPVERGFDLPTPRIGCNHLVCGACGEPVRAWANAVATVQRHVDPVALYADEGEALPPCLSADEVTRVYACACNWTQVRSSQALDIDVTPGTSLFSSRWRCAGHPGGELPADLLADFAPVDETTLAERVAALLGTRSPLRTSQGQPFPSPCLDVWRLEAHLPQHLSRRIRELVRRQLTTSTSPAVLQAALSYARFHPEPEDGAAWLATTTARPALLDLESPDFTGHDLRREGVWLLEALAVHEAERRLPPSPGLVAAFFDHFEHHGVDFRLDSVARLSFGAVLSELAVRELPLRPHSGGALHAVWRRPRKGDRAAARRGWVEGPGTSAQREALLAALPVRLARELASAGQPSTRG